jgi:hypothetical protein
METQTTGLKIYSIYLLEVLDFKSDRLLGFKSIKTVNSTSGFDALKRRLEELTDRVRNEPEDAGARRRLLSCIGQIMADLNDAKYPAHSLRILLSRRFKIIEGSTQIIDLQTHELLNLLRTLKARLATWKDRQTNQASAHALSGEASAVLHTHCSPDAADLPHSTADSFF